MKYGTPSRPTGSRGRASGSYLNIPQVNTLRKGLGLLDDPWVGDKLHGFDRIILWKVSKKGIEHLLMPSL